MLGIAAIARPFLERFLLKRLANGIAETVIWAVVIGSLLAALLIAALYAIYQYALLPQMAASSALLAVCGIVVLLVALLSLLARHRLRHLQRMLRPRPTLGDQLDTIAEAFLDGLFAPRTENKK